MVIDCTFIELAMIKPAVFKFRFSFCLRGALSVLPFKGFLCFLPLPSDYLALYLSPSVLLCVLFVFLTCVLFVRKEH